MRGRLIVATLLATAAHAAPSPDRPAARAACEAFTDARELRFRVPTAIVVGRIAPASVREPDAERPEAGQQLVFGTADLVSDGDGKVVRVSYAYWNARDGCGGWEPGQGLRYTFDLADDKTSDGELRIMRYGAPIGSAAR